MGPMPIKVPDSFKPYLLLIASTQRMEKITPLEIFTCVNAFVGRKKGTDYLDEPAYHRLKAYCNRWNLEDFTDDWEKEIEECDEVISIE